MGAHAARSCRRRSGLGQLVCRLSRVWSAVSAAGPMRADRPSRAAKPSHGADPSRGASPLRAARIVRAASGVGLSAARVTAGVSAAVLVVTGAVVLTRGAAVPAGVVRNLAVPWWFDLDDDNDGHATADDRARSPSRRTKNYLLVGPSISTSPTAAPVPTGPLAVVAVERLAPGMELIAGQAVRSGNGAYLLRMQPDGEAVQTTGTTVLWSSQTAGNPGASLTMQRDGDLVVHSARRAPLWSTRTSGNPGAYLEVDDDGSLAVLSATGQPLWRKL